MKDWIKIIIMIVIVALVLFLGYFLFTKAMSKNKTKEPEEKVINVKKDVYELGDEIIFTKLQDVMFKNENDKRDFSKWRVLFQNKGYLTLYSVADWGEINYDKYYTELGQHRKIMTQYKVFLNNDNDFRLLGKKELELFGCNTFNMTCLNVPDWIGSSVTSVSDNSGFPVVFRDNKISADSINEKFVYHPVIVISKLLIE